MTVMDDFFFSLSSQMCTISTACESSNALSTPALHLQQGRRKVWGGGAIKVNSVQEACVKCFVVHILKFEILQITWKKMKQSTLSFHFFINKSSLLMLFILVFFMWFERFQILVCEPQSIWRKLLVLSWL